MSQDSVIVAGGCSETCEENEEGEMGHVVGMRG